MDVDCKAERVSSMIALSQAPSPSHTMFARIGESYIAYTAASLRHNMRVPETSIPLLKKAFSDSPLLIRLTVSRLSQTMHTPGSGACNTTAHNNSNSTELVGWQDESPGRGTLTLVLTCLTTISLCTWVVIHPRIDKRKRFHLAHKLALFVKALLAPEFIAVEAAQEYTQARRVVKECSRQTNGEFGLVHAFYVGMFGLRYRTPQGSKVLWPNQFVWLLDQQLFDWTHREAWGLTKDLIEDKSKADAAAKLIALLQTAWFVAQSIMRAAHNLPLAPLESMTLGYIPLFAVTYVYWWVKPKDISTPSESDLAAMTAEQKAAVDALTISEAFDYGDRPEQNEYWQIWYLTPRIFEKEEQDRVLQCALRVWESKNEAYRDHLRVCKKQGCATCKRLRPTTVRPTHELVVSHWDPELYHSRLWPVICLFGVSFGALHLASWDTVFPTVVEAWLWRVSAITSMITLLVFMQFEKVVVSWQDPLMLIKILCPLLYLVSRVVMVGGAVAAFRASAPGIYETYEVSTYWVHLL